MKMRYFHQEGGGGVRRVRPMLDPPLYLGREMCAKSAKLAGTSQMTGGGHSASSIQIIIYFDINISYILTDIKK